MTAALSPALRPGFADAVQASQVTFRAVMAAMAEPGTIRPLAADLRPPPPFTATMAAVALTLLDRSTPVFMGGRFAEAAEAGRWLAFHTGARLVGDPAVAAFAFLEGAEMPPLAAFSPGTAEDPDRSATLVVAVERLIPGAGLWLSGPGIPGRRRLSAAPLPPDFWQEVAANGALYPCGVDLILAAPHAVAALPRSTRVEEG